MSKVLVVDASVVRAAGESERPVSSANREFLYSILTICHRVAITQQIGAEWRRHQSKVTFRWRAAMYARKKIVLLDAPANPELRTRLIQGHRDADCDAILKDAHLIESCLKADQIVASLDENARKLFQVAELNVVTWVNPVSERQRIRGWLEEGAPPVEEWQLGNRP